MHVVSGVYAVLSCGDFMVMVGRVAPLVHDADKLASGCQDSQVLDGHTWQENGGVCTFMYLSWWEG